MCVGFTQILWKNVYFIITTDKIFISGTYEGRLKSWWTGGSAPLCQVVVVEVT
jgi:hypothetical protein